MSGNDIRWFIAVSVFCAGMCVISPGGTRGLLAETETLEDVYEHANSLFNQGLYREAEKEYREAIRLDPTFAEARSELGWTLCETGRLQ